MKQLVTVLCALAASAACAFDSGDWLGKRARLDREAERLRSVYAKCVAALQTPAENLVVPIENHPDGSVKATITAAKAQFFIDAGLVWGENVVLCEYEVGGTNVKARVTAEHCVVDRETKSGWADGRVKVEYGRTTLEGDGIYFSFPEEYVKILSNVTIESSDLKFGGVKL